MTTKFLLLVAVFVLFSSLLTVAKAQVNVGDSLALVDLYNSTGGADWINHKNWLTKKPVSTWAGVEVEENRVKTLYLGYNNLTGSLPESIGSLTQLEAFEIENNNVGGTIPDGIGNFSLLTDFTISNNQFSGPLPASIGGMKSMIGLFAEQNQLSGKIPSSIGACRRLSVLHLEYNLFTEVSENLKSAGALTDVYISHNRLRGNIPEIFGGEARIFDLDLSYNELTGTIPADIVKSKYSLHFITLSHNRLSGELPSTLGDLFKLSFFDVSDNELSGEVPTSLLNDPAIYQLFLTHNHFTQTHNIPANRPFHFLASYLDSNNFTFNGLEYIAAETNYHVYSPQAYIPIYTGNSNLFLSAGGTLSNNTYHWFKTGTNDSFIVKGDSTFRPLTNGDYYAYVTNAIATDLQLHTDTVTYTAPLANTELHISISPNPSKGMINIYGLNEKNDAKITVADMSGYIWLSVISRQQSALKIDVTRLKAGNYLVNVSDGKEVKTVQFVKE